MPTARTLRPRVATWLLAGGVATVSASALAAGPGNDPLAWLQRAASAARNVSYSGTFVHITGDRTSAVRISHRVEGGVERERLEPMDGPPLEIVRRNEEMYCYLPEAKTVRRDKILTGRFFPSLFRAPPEEIAQSYEIKLGKVDRIAGHDCQWIRLEPRDALRYAQRLCAELVSGLVLRARTFNERHESVEQYMFTQLKIGPQVTEGDVKSTFEARTKQWQTDARPLDEAKGAATGWAVNNAPPGYRLVMELQRNLPGRAQPVSQIVLSDGLASISVFVEPAGATARAEAASEDGSTSFYVRPSGSHVITVLGEVPLAAAQQVGRSVARRP